MTPAELDAIEAKYFGPTAPWKLDSHDGPICPDTRALIAEVRQLRELLTRARRYVWSANGALETAELNGLIRRALGEVAHG